MSRPALPPVPAAATEPLTSSPLAAHRAPGRPLSLRLLLTMLPVLAVLPLLAFGLVTLGLSWQQQREQAFREVQQSVRTLALAIDRELGASVRELQRLSEHPALDRPDLDTFSAYARRLVDDQAAWDNLVLVGADGRQLLNAQQRPGETLPRIDRRHYRAVFETGRPALSDIGRDTGTDAPSIAVTVPVMHDGQVRYALSARLNADVLAALLAAQAVRSDLVAAILDRNYLLVARNTQHQKYFATPATQDLQEAARAQANGIALLGTLDGRRVLAAWETIPLGWQVVVGLPQALVDAPIRRQLGWMAAGGLLALALALALSLTLARRLERSVALAIDDARSLADGRAPAVRRSRVRELAALFASLTTSHARLTASSQAAQQATASLRENEERLRLVLDSVNVGTFDWHVGSGQMVWSPRTCELFGYPPGAAPPPVEQAMKRVHPEDAGALRQAMEQAMAVDGAFRAQFRVLRPDRPLCWVEAIGQVLFDPEQPEPGGARRPLRFIGVVLDVTAQKTMELSLREADRRKDEFLAMLSHELRNPLTPIANALAILRMQQPPGGQAPAALGIAERQVQQMKRLIDDLLDISRITRGKIVLRLAPLDFAELVRHAVENVQAAAAMRRQIIRVDLPDAPLPLQGDRARLMQVIENLLTNAIKFSAGGGLIEVQARRELRDASGAAGMRDWIVLRVRDEGVGIPADQLDSVFEIFTQLDATLDRSQGGLGIGLALVRRLTEMHGGRVSADSRGPGRGATFTVRLPALPADERERSSTARSAPAAVPAPGARRILVVDDNIDAADTLVTLLQLLGHQAIAVYNGESALAQAAAFGPDTVLLDIGLPDVNGLDVGRRLRERQGGERLTLVAVSGYGQDHDRAATAAAGFDAHLVKPVQAEDLERVLGTSGG